MRYSKIIDVMPEDRTWWRSAAAPDRMGDGVLENSVKRERPLTKGSAESVMLNGRPRDQIEDIKCPLLNPYTAQSK